MITPTTTLEVLCSVQRALLGAVTANLRAVSVLMESETVFRLVFYFQEESSEAELEVIELAFSYFSADFPPPKYETAMEIHVRPAPALIPQRGRLVYERYEVLKP